MPCAPLSQPQATLAPAIDADVERLFGCPCLAFCGGLAGAWGLKRLAASLVASRSAARPPGEAPEVVAVKVDGGKKLATLYGADFEVLCRLGTLKPDEKRVVGILI